MWLYSIVALFFNPLLAQFDAGQPTTLLAALLAAFTALVGLVVWIVKKMLDSTIPNLQTTFAKTLADLQTTYSSSLEKQQTAFSEALGRQETAGATLIGNLQRNYREDSNAEREFFRQELGTMRGNFLAAYSATAKTIESNQDSIFRIREQIEQMLREKSGKNHA